MPTTYVIDPSQWPEIWQAAYRILEQAIVPNQLRAWIQPLTFVGSETLPDGIQILLQAENDWSADWVKRNYLSALENAFSQVSGVRCNVSVGVHRRERDAEASPSSSESVGAPTYNPTAEPAPPYAGNDPTPPTSSVPTFSPEPIYRPMNSMGSMSSLRDPGPREREYEDLPQIQGPVVIRTDQRGALDPTIQPDARYTFDAFVVGASNQFAYASAIAVAEQPARQYNPLFIFSAPGLGKTHLLHAIGNHMLQRNPGARVAYLSAERFVNELIDSLQHHRMPQFRSKYRDSFDIILIDDIQFIAGKTKSEEEFFHTFNALHSSKRQIVITSDRPPKDIEGLEERVRTRFEWGLVADVHPPEIETRIAILKAKAERDDIYLPDDVATFLATFIKTNVRELEGILIRLQAQASLTGAEISIEMAKLELRTSIPEEGSHYTIETIQNAVAKHYQIKIQDLKSTARSRSVALPRQIGMYLIRKYTGMGFKEIGGYFGGKDHTTILHACQKIEKGVEADIEIREAVESIQNLL